MRLTQHTLDSFQERRRAAAANLRDPYTDRDRQETERQAERQRLDEWHRQQHRAIMVLTLCASLLSALVAYALILAIVTLWRNNF